MIYRNTRRLWTLVPRVRWLYTALVGIAVVLCSATATLAAAQPEQYVDHLYNGQPAAPKSDTSTMLVSPSMFTGASVASVPIVAPPGTGGVQPQLTVSYNSGRSAGNAGTGWSVTLPKITRSTHYGSDLAQQWLKQDAVYLFEGDELVRGSAATDPFNCAATEYYRKVQRFQKFYFCEGSDYWVVIQKDGTILTFGKIAANNSRLVKPSSSTTMEYFLDRIENTHGLAWEAQYSAYGSPNAESAPRLESVEYTCASSPVEHTCLDGGPVGKKRIIDLVWESRPDGQPDAVSWTYGFIIASDQRLAAVEVLLDDGASTERVRKFAFSYSDSSDNERSLLTSAQLFGQSDNESLPAQTFTYQWNNPPAGNPGFSSGGGWSSPAGFGLQDQLSNGAINGDTLDLNGDGYLDQVDATPSLNWNVWFGRPEGGFASSASAWIGTTKPAWPFGSYQIREMALDGVDFWDVAVDTLDMNGDGLPDLFMGDEIGLNDGVKFTQQAWGGPSGLVRDYEIISADNKGTIADLIDVTGDGCPDKVVVVGSSWRFYRNLACDPQPQLAFSSSPQILRSGAPSYIEKNYSYHFEPECPPISFPPCDPRQLPPPTTWAATTTGWLDINGDSLPDHYDAELAQIRFGTGERVLQDYSNTTSYIADLMYIWGNEVTGPPLVSVQMPVLSGSGGGGGNIYGFIDMNSDGLVDFVETDAKAGTQYSSSHQGEWYVWFNTGRGFIRNHATWITNTSYTVQGGLSRGGANAAARTADFDGDGIKDWAFTFGSSIYVAMGSGEKPDLISQISNGTGATTTLSYGARVGGDYGDAGGESMPAGVLHFAQHVLTQVETDPGMGGPTYTTDLTYWTPFYDRAERKFRGFAVVETNRSDDIGTADSYARYYFAHGDPDRTIFLLEPGGPLPYPDHPALAGRRFGVKKGPNASTIKEEAWTAWQASSQGSGIFAPQMTHRFTWTDGLVADRWTAANYAYDTTYGNLTDVDDFGEINGTTGDPAEGNDERYLDISYAENAAKWIVSLPSERTILDAVQQPLRKTTILYDDYSTPGSVDVGDVTKTSVLVSYPGESDTAADTLFTHDIYGNVLTTTDPVGAVTTFEWHDGTPGPLDSHVYLHTTEKVVAAGKQPGQEVTLVTSTTWDEGLAVPLTVVGPIGDTKVNHYDELGRLTSVESSPPDNPAGPLILRSESFYTLDGGTGGDNLIESRSYFGTGPSDFYTSRVYSDGLLRPIQSKSEAEGGNWTTTSQRYTHHGSSDRATVPYFTTVAGYTPFDFNAPTPQEAATTRSVVDWAGRPTSEFLHAADGTQYYLTTKSYQGWDVWSFDAKGYRTDYLGGTRGLAKVIQRDEFDAPQATLTYTYNRVGDLLEVEDQDGVKWQMTYDTRGLRRTLVDPDMSNCPVPENCPWEYEYDLKGRLTRQIDSEGESVRMDHDELDRMYFKDYECTSCPDEDITIEFDEAANGLGLTHKVIRGTSFETTYAYDAWQREASITTRVVDSTRTTGMQYDLLGRTTVLTYPTSETAAYTYSASGPETVTFASNPIVTGVTYDAFGRETQRSWGNGLTTFRTWADHEKTEQIRVAGGVDLLNMTYGYDAAGNTTQIIESVSDWRREYDYDWAHRLVEGRHLIHSTSTLQQTWGYEYSPNGNMDCNSLLGSCAADGAYTYGNNAGPHAVTQVGSNYNLTYDARGNLITEQETGEDPINYTYDRDGRMTHVSDLTQPVDPDLTLEYDGFTDRARKTWTAPDSTSREVRYFDTHFEELFEDTTQFNERYVLFGDSRVAYVTDKNPGKTFFLHPDVQGTIGFITDEVAAVIEQKTFGPYGDLYSAMGGSTLRYGYTGEEHDAEVALTHLGVRQQHPVLARFTNPDALIPHTTSTQAYNPYAYARNNPVSYIDPSGYFWEDPDGPPCGPRSWCEGGDQKQATREPGAGDEKEDVYVVSEQGEAHNGRSLAEALVDMLGLATSGGWGFTMGVAQGFIPGAGFVSLQPIGSSSDLWHVAHGLGMMAGGLLAAYYGSWLAGAGFGGGTLALAGLQVEITIPAYLLGAAGLVLAGGGVVNAGLGAYEVSSSVQNMFSKGKRSAGRHYSEKGGHKERTLANDKRKGGHRKFWKKQEREAKKDMYRRRRQQREGQLDEDEN